MADKTEPKDTPAFKRHILLSRICEESARLENNRPGGPLLYKISNVNMEATKRVIDEDSKLQALHRGEMLRGNYRAASASNAPVSPMILTDCLRATFKKLGIQPQLVRQHEGVYVFTTTLDALVAWADKRVEQSSVRYEAAANEFLIAFNEVANAQALERGRKV